MPSNGPATQLQAKMYPRPDDQPRSLVQRVAITRQQAGFLLTGCQPASRRLSCSVAAAPGGSRARRCPPYNLCSRGAPRPSSPGEPNSQCPIALRSPLRVTGPATTAPGNSSAKAVALPFRRACQRHPSPCVVPARLSPCPYTHTVTLRMSRLQQRNALRTFIKFQSGLKCRAPKEASVKAARTFSDIASIGASKENTAPPAAVSIGPQLVLPPPSSRALGHKTSLFSLSWCAQQHCWQ